MEKHSSCKHQPEYLSEQLEERAIRKVSKCSGSIILVEAKGVAGLGKAGGDSQGGSDKAGQQVPPEVYQALTYAGSAFLLSLSVPFLCYGGNKLLNKILACCGRRDKPPSTNKQEAKKQRSHQVGQEQQKQETTANQLSNLIEQLDRQPFANQHLHQQLMQQQYSKYHKTHPFAMSCTDGQIRLMNIDQNNNNQEILRTTPVNNSVMNPTMEGSHVIKTQSKNDQNCRIPVGASLTGHQKHPAQNEQQQQHPFTISSPHL